MNENEMKQVWRASKLKSLDVAPQTAAIEKEKRRERFRRWTMITAGLNLTLATSAFIWAERVGKVDLAEAWPVAALMILLWATFIEFIRFRARQKSRFQKAADDIATGLKWAASQAEATARELIILILINLMAATPVTIAAGISLFESGKLSSSEALSFSIFSGMLLIAQLVALAFYQFRKALPRKAALNALCNDIKKMNDN